MTIGNDKLTYTREALFAYNNSASQHPSNACVGKQTYQNHLRYVRTYQNHTELFIMCKKKVQ